MSTQHDVRMEEIRQEAARKISETLSSHLDHIKSENMRVYPYNSRYVETAARITESLANALAAVAR